MILIKWSLEEGEISRSKKTDTEISKILEDNNSVQVRCDINPFDHYRVRRKNTFFTVIKPFQSDLYVRGFRITAVVKGKRSVLPLYTGIYNKAKAKVILREIRGALRTEYYKYYDEDLYMLAEGNMYKIERNYKREPLRYLEQDCKYLCKEGVE